MCTLLKCIVLITLTANAYAQTCEGMFLIEDTKKEFSMDMFNSEELANQRLKAIENLSLDFKDAYSNIAIKQFWNREGLSLLEKSLSSLAQRVMLGRFTNFSFQMDVYIASGGSLDNLKSLIIESSDLFPEKNISTALELISQKTSNINKPIDTESRIFRLSALIASGRMIDITDTLIDYFNSGMRVDQVRNVLAHTIIESGFPSAMNGFAAMRNALKNAQAEDLDNFGWPTQSFMMNNIYGEIVANNVYQRLQELDPYFNWACQDIAYSTIWAREGLSTRDKSLITVVILIAQGKEEQTQIHMNGYLNSDGSVERLRQSLLYTSNFSSESSIKTAYQGLTEVVEDRSPPANTLKDINDGSETELQKRDKILIQISALLASGKQKELEQALLSFSKEDISNKEIVSLLMQSIVYAGFTAAEDGFYVLSNVIEKRN